MPIIDGCRSCCSLDNRFCCPRSVVYYFNIFIHEKLGTLDLMVSYHSMVSWYGMIVHIVIYHVIPQCDISSTSLYTMV